MERTPPVAGDDPSGMGHVMTRKFGWFLSSEEYSPEQLVDQALLAEQAGFERCGSVITFIRGSMSRVTVPSSGPASVLSVGCAICR